jgi:glycosyltransferase involved in cell wall biosynthesis
MRSIAGTWAPGRAVGWLARRCYAISEDAADLAVRYLGVPPGKVVVSPLGVDATRFHPSRSAADHDARVRRRDALGVAADEVLFVYSGRLSADKDPFCLARAVADLRSRGAPARALFVGSGTQELAIRAQPGSVVMPFVPFPQLPELYRSADVGVWPRQESTSMLDAAASGLPIVVSDRVQSSDRVAGNGLVYREGDAAALADALAQLLDGERRRTLGAAGAERVAREQGWEAIARRRVSDYESLPGPLRRRPNR